MAAKDPRMNKEGTAGKRKEACNCNSSSETCNSKGVESDTSRSVVMASYSVG